MYPPSMQDDDTVNMGKKELVLLESLWVALSAMVDMAVL